MCSLRVAPLQEIFKPTSSCFSGFGQGLLGALDKQWEQRCSMILDSDSSRAGCQPSGESLCNKLRMCVCSAAGQDAYHFLQNMTSLLKPYLQAKRKPRAKKTGVEAVKAKAKKEKPDYPPARLQVQSAFLVLRLRVSERKQPGEFPAVEDVSSSSAVGSQQNGWFAAVCRKAQEFQCQDEIQGPREVYYHIGYMNFQNWQFSGLELNFKEYRSDGGINLEAPSPPVFSKGLQFILSRIDHKFMWTLSVYQIRSTATDIPAAAFFPGEIIVDEYAEIPDMLVWHGAKNEEEKRRQQTKKRPPAGSGQTNRPEKKKTNISIPEALENVYGEEQIAEQFEEFGSENEDEEFDLGDEEVFDDDVPDMHDEESSKRKKLAKKLWPGSKKTKLRQEPQQTLLPQRKLPNIRHQWLPEPKQSLRRLPLVSVLRS